MKRRPPADNARRVRHIDGNYPSNFTSKTNRIVQCESDHEFVLCMQFERDAAVLDYISQPETIRFVDTQGRKHSYTPDYKVWRSDGSEEYWEFTMTFRREAHDGPPERERAAAQIFRATGARYIVVTEEDLPGKTEQANLRHLFGFRATSYLDPDIVQALPSLLLPGQPMRFAVLRDNLAEQLDLPRGRVGGALMHLLWFRHLDADFSRLFFVNDRPNHRFEVWMPTI